MFLRILLGVACVSLLASMTASEAEAQLFRRRFTRQQPQQQPQQQAPQVKYSQNGYQGQLTASSRNRPMFVRRADGSVVRYYPTNSAQSVANRSKQASSPAVPSRPKTQPVTPPVAKPKLATTQGQLQAVRPTLQMQRRVGSVYQPPANVAPVGVSVMNQPTIQTTIGSIVPATPMPQASMSTPVDAATSIPVSTTATNPAPTGLSLSQPKDVLPASANVLVETPSAGQTSEPETFSVLETIE